ncbi:MAG: photosynthesis system II assembly factor Ycf48 [Prochlorococcaceae cyanobacterium ETNP7_MAG_30]|nr:photosynthesis system II assembly factor Ycf48 [Prochlorococcaceae cyanobacterium ETNP7_MAG_30]
MNRLFSQLFNLLLIVAIGIGLGGCVTSRLSVASTSPWQALDLKTEANPLDISFSNPNHGFVVGTNRLIMETNDGGVSWKKRSLDLPQEENFRLISVDFHGDEGWIAGQPGLVMHSTDAGQNWTQLTLENKLPGDPYLIISKGDNSAELATNAGAIYRTSDGGTNWEATVSEAAGAVRDLRRSEHGNYVSVSSLGNFFSTLDPGQDVWQTHQRISSKRVQTVGFQPNGELWMVARGAQIRFNNQPGDVESWSKPIVPITNGYNYLDLSWDPDGSIWAAGGNGTLVVSKDQGESWQIDPLGNQQPSNLIRILFETSSDNQAKGFVLGERGHLLRWVG